MPLRLPDKWVWDFWLARRRRRPPHLLPPGARGRSATRRCAITTPRSATPSPATSPLAVLAGRAPSRAAREAGTTSPPGRAARSSTTAAGTCSTPASATASEGLVQRIGLAVSDDLVHWDEAPGEPGARGRRPLVRPARPGPLARPVLARPVALSATGGRVVPRLITARSPDGLARRRRAWSPTPARATSSHWEVLPPLTRPGEFAQVEAPQLVRVDGRFDILVSCQAEDHSQERIERLGIPGAPGHSSSRRTISSARTRRRRVRSRRRDGPLGPLYAGKLVEDERR